MTRAALDKIRALVDEQAEDEALWAIYPLGQQPIAEAYLQQELRRLHALIEAVTEPSRAVTRAATETRLIGESAILAELVEMATLVVNALHDEDGIAFHYAGQGLEFSAMRAVWFLGNEVEAARLHRLVGDHSPDKCPICVGEDAYKVPGTVPGGTHGSPSSSRVGKYGAS